MSKATFMLPRGPVALEDLTLEEARDVILMLMDSYEAQRKLFLDYQRVDQLGHERTSPMSNVGRLSEGVVIGLFLGIGWMFVLLGLGVLP